MGELFLFLQQKVGLKTAKNGVFCILLRPLGVVGGKGLEAPAPSPGYSTDVVNKTLR